ncbi:hypothetical protein VNO77_24960 [Canavalia gladiata]|uniref:Uncharacterized protein n=1 Tax=Canavalia gladiata TaxID=3824 RepID=A0AAN9L8M5_CANGL
MILQAVSCKQYLLSDFLRIISHHSRDPGISGYLTIRGCNPISPQTKLLTRKCHAQWKSSYCANTDSKD